MADLTIPVPNLGVMAHLDRRDVPPRGLAEAENWIFKNGEFQVRPGEGTFGDDIISGRWVTSSTVTRMGH